jgi:NADP-dependent 3-hydroxy acid dehydrogenase YdfG
MAKKMFLVYCAENQSLAAELSAELAALGIAVHADCRLPETRTENAMAMARSHAPVLLLVTDNFLRSLDCIDGFSELLKTLESQLVVAVAPGTRPDPNNPSATVVVPTAFDTVNEVMQYRDYWYETWVGLRKLRSASPESEQSRLDAEVAIAQKASTATGSFLRQLRELGPIPLDRLRADQCAELIARARFEEALPVSFPEAASEPAIPFTAALPLDIPVEPVESNLLENTTFERIASKGFEEQDEQTPAQPEVLPAAESVAPEAEEPIEETPREEPEETDALLSDSYMESVNREMEKAARIIKEFAGDQDEPDGTLDFSPKENPLSRAEDEWDKILRPAEEPVPQSPSSGYVEFLAAPPNDPALAIENLQAIVERDANNEAALRHLAELCASQERFAESLALYDRIIALRPGDAEAYFKAAVLLEEKWGDREKAAVYYKDALYLDDHHPRYHFRYAQLLQHFFEKEKKAAKHYKRAIELDNSFAEAHLALAELYAFYLEKPEKAAKHYALAVAIDPALRAEELEGLLTGEADQPITKVRNRPIGIRLPGQADPRAAVLALVTGATSGIGKATARLLAEQGCRLLLAGRRMDRLEALAQELRTEYGTEVHLLSFDVREQLSVDAAFASLPENWREVDVLINNAGLAKGLAPIDEGEIEHWNTMIDTNVKGLLYITRAVAPGMVSRKRGHIVNISSTAAKEVYPKGNVYCATKFAVDALNRGMRMDLCPHHIRVTAICPGHTEHTEFALVRFDNDSERAKIYEDFLPLKAEDVAEAVWFALSRPPHVNINEMVLSGTQQASATIIHRSGRNPF